VNGNSTVVTLIKEYFAQDWFAERLGEAGLPLHQQGRNSYPDYWVTADPVEGYEVKSLGLKANGQPARGDLDFNSGPSGIVINLVYRGRIEYVGGRVTAAEPRLAPSLDQHSLSISLHSHSPAKPRIRRTEVQPIWRLTMSSPTPTTTTPSNSLPAQLEQIGLQVVAGELDDFLARATKQRWCAPMANGF